MRLISFVVRHARKTFFVALLAGVASGATNVAFLAVINRAVRGGDAPSALLWAFVGLCVALPVTRFISESLLARFGQGALFELRMQLARQVMTTPLRHLEEVGPHRLMAAFTDDLVAITNALLVIPVISINAAVVLCALVYMGWLSGWLLLAVLAFMVAGILTYRFPLARAQRYLRLAREESNHLLDHLRALTAGSKELKLHHRRRVAFLEDLFHPTASSFRAHNVSGLTVYTAAASWGQALVFVVVGLVLFVLPSFRPASPETLTGYALALLYMMAPLQVIMNSVPGVARADVALKKIDELRLSLAAQPSDVGADAPPAPKPEWKRIELSGVTHAYWREGEESSFTLGPIDLSLSRGELVFLVGGNGSGKTTLGKIFVGLYAPEGGHIYLDGDPVTEATREAYREYFSVVFSDFHLFESLLGLDAPRLDDRARQYLKELQLDHKVEVKDGALSTVSLSQGQRKRLALLTAYLEDRPVYLFDEWAADQDPHFKEVFYLKLLPELKARGKTVVVISHDDRYFHVADRIVKLEYGRLAGEFGQELAACAASNGDRRPLGVSVR